MAEHLQKPHSPVLRFRNAYDSSLAEICAVPEPVLVPITLDVPGIVTVVLGVWPKVRGLRSTISNTLADFPIHVFDKLLVYALALGYAHTIYETVTKRPSHLTALAKEGLFQRAILFADATALAKRGIVEAKLLKGLHGTHGYKNVAFDLLALSNMLRTPGALSATRAAVNESDLDKVECLAEKLLVAASWRNRSSDTIIEATRNRQAAFTLLVNAYNEVRAAIVYLRRQRGDADTFVPSLYVGRAKKKRSKSTKAPTHTELAPATPALTGSALPRVAQLNATQEAATGPFL